MAFKTFANGFPLPASDLNNFLMKQSVIVFADEAARTAALSEPTEGMVTYLEDDNELYKWTGASWVNIADLSSAIPKSTVTTAGDLIVADGASSVSRLGIGAADTVLTSNGTTATWEEAGGGGGNYTLITSGTLSSEVLSIDSIPQDYDDLVLECSFETIFNIRVNDIDTSNYQFSRQQSNSTTLQQSTATFWQFAAGDYHRITLWDYTRNNIRLGGEAFVKGSGDPTLKWLLGTAITFAPITKITTNSVETGTFALYGKSFV